MRQDMAKVIVERPRVGGGKTKKGREANAPLDELPLREPMRNRRKFYSSKELNENLAPLRRFLISKAGQKWDDIYSEICQNLRLDSAIQKHIRDHLRDLVVLDAFMGADWRVYKTGYAGPYCLEESGPYEMYVHPVTRRLVYRQWKKNWIKERLLKKKEERGRTVRSISPLLQCHKIDGIWYELHLAKLPALKTHEVNGVVVKTNWDMQDKFFNEPAYCLGGLRFMANRLLETYGRPDVYCIRKVQCSKKTIRDFKLQ